MVHRVTSSDEEREKIVSDARESLVGARASVAVPRSNATRVSLAMAVKRRLGFSQSESRRLVDDVFDVLSDFLVDSGKMKIPFFGSFIVRSKSARVGRNPRTGEIVPIAPRRVVSFRPSVNLRKRLKVGVYNSDVKRSASDGGIPPATR